MPNINVVLNSASIQVLDLVTNLFRINSSIGTVSLPALAASYDAYLQVPGGAGSVLDLPTATIWVMYVKNIDLTNGLTVQSLVSGVLGTVAVLGPGGVCLVWNSVETSAGITGVTL